MAKQKPEIFIGSSTSGLDIARQVERKLKHVATVILWTKLFGLGEGTLEALIKATSNFDFAVIVLSPDDLLETGGQNYASPRDNVLFELGLFMGSLGRKRTFILSDERANLKLPSDLDGITRATYRKQKKLSTALSNACTIIIQAIRDQGMIGPEERSADFGKFWKLGMSTVDYPMFYEDLRKLLEASTEIKVLKTWFPENKVIAEGLKRAIMKRRAHAKLELKLLLCHPDSSLLQLRSQTALNRRHLGSSIVYQTIENIDKWLRERSAPKGRRSAPARYEPSVEIRCYDSWPGCPVIWCDDTILMGFYFRGAPSPEWPWISVRKESWLAERLNTQFEDLWDECEGLKTEGERDIWLKKNEKWKETWRRKSPKRSPNPKRKKDRP